MPFIRYEIGDLGRASDKTCPCGRGLPMMEVVEGRTTDSITAPDGKLIHGEFFTHLFYRIEGVKKFQVVQESLADLVIKIQMFLTF